MQYRLNTYISGSGYCSRREADRLIEAGRVTVDGKKASIGGRVLPGQVVRVNGEEIASDITPVYIAFNKPIGVVSSSNPKEKDNIVEFISHEQRIFPIGRLDKDSQGLILLTNDGDIVNKILRAGNNHKKEYIVTVNRPITDDFLKRMANGVPILDRVTRKCEIERITDYIFKITLIQGLNRQIRRMCEYFGYEVLKLERIRIMNITLGNLGQGNWRNLTHDELNGLFDMLEASEKKQVPATRLAAGTIKVAKKETPKEKISEKKPKEKVEKLEDLPTKKAKKMKENKAGEIVAKSAPKKKTTGPRVGKQRLDKIEKNTPKPRKWYTNPTKKK